MCFVCLLVYMEVIKCFLSDFSGGPVSCIASLFVCNVIFTSILGFSGNINVC